MPVIDAARIKARMADLDLSQSELARRVGVSQSAIHKLVSGNAYGSTHLHRIARELGTTPAYLTGEIDDPDGGAPAPAASPRFQTVMMPVTMPSEAALAEMYEAQLRALGRLQGAELARALAKRLPRALARLQAADLYEETDEVVADDGAPPLPATDRPARRRAQHT
jgi:transcriptional regulator with XRE-family HTH domain